MGADSTCASGWCSSQRNLKADKQLCADPALWDEECNSRDDDATETHRWCKTGMYTSVCRDDWAHQGLDWITREGFVCGPCTNLTYEPMTCRIAIYED